MLVVRRFKKEDIHELSKIYDKAYKSLKFAESWGIKNAKNLLNFYFNQKKFLGLTALVDKKIVGASICFAMPWCEGDYIGGADLFIHPDYQNQKIGTKLFLETMKIADKRKYTYCDILVHPRAEKWYRKIGFGEDSDGYKYLSARIKEVIKKIKK